MTSRYLEARHGKHCLGTVASLARALRGALRKCTHVVYINLSLETELGISFGKETELPLFIG